MKKIKILFVALLCALGSIVFAQKAKKPTIMVIPSDLWCNTNGYMEDYDDQGSVVSVPDYKKAFQNSTELIPVISKINELMAERGFPLKNLESTLKSIEVNAAEDEMLTSKNSGSNIAESPYDKIRAKAKPDIIIQLTWTVNQRGPENSITFTMQALDAYTNKQIGGASGTGQPSYSADTKVLLEEAVLAHMDNFTYSLQTHFEDLFANGREVMLEIKRWEDWDKDLESSFGENQEELQYIIEDWVAENSVNGVFGSPEGSENKMSIPDIRIPLFAEHNGRTVAMDSRRFGRNLMSYLKSKYGISGKVLTKGLGQVVIILGEK